MDAKKGAFSFDNRENLSAIAEGEKDIRAKEFDR